MTPTITPPMIFIYSLCCTHSIIVPLKAIKLKGGVSGGYNPGRQAASTTQDVP
jgi:hypothetical protein